MSLKNVLAVALGIMSAIGGFVDIGDLVFNTQAGAIFGFQLLWVVVIGVVGIIVYSEMCGRVSAVAERPVFDLVRERTGFGAGLATLIASEIVNLMTCAAEIGGAAICFQLLSGLPYRVLIPVAVLALAVTRGYCRSGGSSACSAISVSACSSSPSRRSSFTPSGAKLRTVSCPARTPVAACWSISTSSSVCWERR